MSQIDHMYYLFGSNEYLINKYKKMFITKKEKEGYNVESLQDTLPVQTFNFFTDKTLYIIDPSLFDEVQLINWLDSLINSVVLFISIKKYDFLIEKLKSNNIKEFKLPDFFHQKAEATSFLITELKNYGKIIAQNLASVIVQRCGSDYGTLSFEAFKINYLSGSNEITLSDVQGALSGSLDSSLPSFLESLSLKSERELLRQLSLLKKSIPDGNIVSICSYITPTVLKWYAASLLSEEGKTISEAATFLGINPWYYENTILPSAKLWGKGKLQRLVEHLAECHRLGLSGAFNPWGYFESGLIDLLD